MTTPLKLALSPIRCAAAVCATQGSGVFPPDPLLSYKIDNFVKAWSQWRAGHEEGAAEGSAKYQINSQCINAFFTHLESICAKFPDYNYPAHRGRIFGLNSAIMTTIPWEWLLEDIRKETLSRIFAQKEFRQRFWHDYLELSQTVGTNVQNLGMNQHVATALLEYEDIRLEFLSLSLQKILVFFAVLPHIVLKVVQQVYYFWCHDRLSTDAALEILKPVSVENNKDNTSRFQASFFVAEIYLGQGQLAAAKPYLDALSETNSTLSDDQLESVQDYHVAYRGNLSNRLSELSQNLKVYLSNRKTDGFFYSLGIKNKQLSDKKNNLVEALSTDIDSFINKIHSEEGAVDNGEVQTLLCWLVRAQTMNASYYQQYKRSFDGVGTLGGTLRTARECLEEFIAQPISSPDNAHSIPRVI